jgi:hypothetical protein
MADKQRIIVCGMVGLHPLGGVAWDYFHYLLALAELGHEVVYHEDTWCWVSHPVLQYPVEDPSYSVAFIREFFGRHAPHLQDRWHYLHLHEQHHGMSGEAFAEFARSADVFLNVSGASFFPDELNPRAKKVFLDTDPGYNQIVLATRPAWSENVDRWVEQVRSHDVHLTYAENLRDPSCPLPTLDLDWRPTRCVVTLPPWESARARRPRPSVGFTTVMSWSYLRGKLIWDGVEYGGKPLEYARFHDLPRRVRVPLTLAVGGQQQPTEQIAADGWQRIDSLSVSRTGQEYIDFIADSTGEWSIAKNCYVAPKTGWFSCRTACYLAAGRPAVVQDTGWSRYVPSGAGVIAFDTMDEAVAALHDVKDRWAHHSAAAYEVAREYLAPDRVLPQMLESIFASPRRPASIGDAT